jgi:parallel beta-helix repeat protein
MRKVILLAAVLLSTSLVWAAKFFVPVLVQSSYIYPDDFPGQTLDQAIHNETVPENARIIVRGLPFGPYYEPLNVNKSIALEGGLGGDTILDGGGSGVVVDISVGNVIIKDFTVRNGEYGIRVGTLNSSVSNVVLENNSVMSNSYGIYILHSNNCILRNNNLAGNQENFGVEGYGLEDFIQDVDTSNTINGWPIYYWVNKTVGTISGHAGYVAVVNSTHVQIENLNMGNNYQGILLAYTSNSVVGDSVLSHNSYGIRLYSSEYNEIRNNSLTGNTVGLDLEEFSENNTIVYNDIEKNGFGISFGVSDYSNNNIAYQNNFIRNNFQVTPGSLNFLNNSREGNYWDTYIGTDLDLDGVYDPMVPYLGLDYHPLVEQWQTNRTFSVTRYGSQSYFVTLSNSTVARASVNWNRGLRRIGFNITSGTAESINTTIPRDWLDGPFETKLNATQLDPSSFSVNQDGANSYISIVYDPGTYMVEIIGTRVLGYRNGDVNNDGVVNILDAIILANSFLKTDS